MGAARRLDRDRHLAGRTIFCDRRRVSRPFHFVQRAHDKKNAKRNDEKINEQRNEVPVIPRDRASFERVRRCVKCSCPVFRSFENNKLIRKIEAAREQTDRRHDDVFD